MTTEAEGPTFDDIADIYWRLGVMSSPSQLHGFLVGLLAVGYPVSDSQWLELAANFIDPVDAPAEADQLTFLDLLGTTRGQLEAGGVELRLLLPDDAVEITQRVDSLGQWCQGFLAGFALGGKQRQQEAGQQQYPSDVSELLGDMAAISQAGLGEGDESEQERETSYMEIAEYLKVAAINIHLECQRLAAEPAETPAPQTEPVSPDRLFGVGPGKDKLH